MLKKVEIDEIELYLELLKSDDPMTINSSTYSTIAEIIQSNFGVECSEHDIFLIHEPTIEELEEDLRSYYAGTLNLY